MVFDILKEMTGEEFLESKQIWSHPNVVSDITGESFEVADLLDEIIEITKKSIMGLFDYVDIDINKLPLSDEEKELIGAEKVFQTKDLKCLMSRVEITQEGRLLYIEEYSGKGDLKDMNYHGVFNFYTSVEGIPKRHWFEFNAKFTDGNLVGIERIPKLH